ncbi:MAG: hypothetical protein C0179_05435 [Fervidicoccus sp.]|nr:MAG: hypothetical protein C0179_05435 [Fervidicoccus sp.]
MGSEVYKEYYSRFREIRINLYNLRDLVSKDPDLPEEDQDYLYDQLTQILSLIDDILEMLDQRISE